MTDLSVHTPRVVSDGDRIRRLLGRFIGGGYVAYFAVSIPEIRTDSAIVASWWTPVSIVLAFAPGWALLVASFLRYPWRIGSAIPLACGGGYLVALALWFMAWNGIQIAGPRTTWLVLFPGLASLAMVLGRWPWLACLHLLISIPGTQFASSLGRSGGYSTWATIADLIWAWAFSAVFVLAGIMAVRTGDILDVTREHAAVVGARAAEQQARDAERAWYDALIHDRVLMVMQHVRDGSADPQLMLQAQQAMDELEAGAPAGSLTDVDLMTLLRTVIADIDIDIAVVGGTHTDGGIELPAAVIQDIVAAAAEAARNCVRHAGRDSTAAVHVEWDDDQVRVAVVDDGDGFDPKLVRRDRMGLAVSIERRMTLLGGRATVDTRPGRGTRVLLEWPACW